MKKTTIWLLLTATMFLFSSCIHDETSATNTERTFTSKVYSSKSLWKEDEVYIKNVKKYLRRMLTTSISERNPERWLGTTH